MGMGTTAHSRGLSRLVERRLSSQLGPGVPFPRSTGRCVQARSPCDHEEAHVICSCVIAQAILKTDAGSRSLSLSWALEGHRAAETRDWRVVTGPRGEAVAVCEEPGAMPRQQTSVQRWLQQLPAACHKRSPSVKCTHYPAAPGGRNLCWPGWRLHAGTHDSGRDP